MQWVSVWLYLGQFSASVGLGIYSVLTRQWVFVVLNVVLALALSLATGLTGLVSEVQAQAARYESSARQAILMDSGSGKVLYEKNADDLMHRDRLSLQCDALSGDVDFVGTHVRFFPRPLGEGTLRQHHRKWDEYVDVEFYSILKSEWSNFKQ